jgi:hypothetical protein
MDNLPEDILLIIFNQLNYIDNINLLKVNKTFNKFIKHNNHISLNKSVDLDAINEPDKLISIFPNIKFYYNKNDDKLLKYIKYIYSLSLSYCDINSFNNFNNLEHLKCLYLEETKISNIDFLVNYHNLRVLNLSWCLNIDNFEVLSNLKKIEILDLSYTNINNLDCLSNLENLRILSLINTNINNDDLDILLNFKNLTYIDLRDNNLNRELFKKFNKFKVTIMMN